MSGDEGDGAELTNILQVIYRLRVPYVFTFKDRVKFCIIIRIFGPQNLGKRT